MRFKQKGQNVPEPEIEISLEYLKDSGSMAVLANGVTILYFQANGKIMMVESNTETIRKLGFQIKNSAVETY